MPAPRLPPARRRRFGAILGQNDVGLRAAGAVGKADDAHRRRRILLRLSGGVGDDTARRGVELAERSGKNTTYSPRPKSAQAVKEQHQDEQGNRAPHPREAPKSRYAGGCKCHSAPLSAADEIPRCSGRLCRCASVRFAAPHRLLATLIQQLLLVHRRKGGAAIRSRRRNLVERRNLRVGLRRIHLHETLPSLPPTSSSTARLAPTEE